MSAAFYKKPMSKPARTLVRCPHCQRERFASARAFAENPYCAECLHERVALRGPVAGVAVLEGPNGMWTIMRLPLGTPS